MTEEENKSENPPAEGSPQEGAPAENVVFNNLDENKKEAQGEFIKDPNEDKPNSDDLKAVYDVPVEVSAVLGKASMQIGQVLKLSRGAVIELDRMIGESIDILVNDRLVARGDVIIVENRLGVTMTEIVKSEKNSA